jgi:hypothetical protein
MPKLRIVHSVIIVASALAACAPKPPTSTPSAPAQLPPSEGPAPAVNPALRGLVDLAISDLARRLNVDRASIAVVEARAVVWPDGALGCPRPGLTYPQVQQEGARVRLAVRGREYAYHSGGSRPPFLCESA